MQILITKVDRHRINDSIEWLSSNATRGSGLARLRRRMSESILVDPSDIPPTCVTMNSRVRLRYHSTDETRDLRLIYPKEPASLEGAFDSVSVISPVGSTLLGSHVGDVVEWQAPSGSQKGEVVAILYQPEANGDPD